VVKKLAQKIIYLFLLFLKPLGTIYRNLFSYNDSILVLALQRLGDTVFLIPALKHIVGNKKGKIIFVAFEENAPILKWQFPEIEVITIQKSEFKLNGRILSKAELNRLKLFRSKEIIDLSGGIHTAILTFMMRVKTKIGINDKYLSPIYNSFVSKSNSKHLMESFLSLFESDAKLSNVFQLKTNRIDNILIAPFAGWKAKEWKLDNYLELAKRLDKKYNVAISIPSNKEVRKIFEKNNFKVLETTSTEELLEVIDKYDLIIGNDSGPVYIAYMMGKFTVSFYGPTNPFFSAPIDDGHLIILNEVQCSPGKNEQYCIKDAGRKDCYDFICMKGITVEYAQNQIENYINSINSN